VNGSSRTRAHLVDSSEAPIGRVCATAGPTPRPFQHDGITTSALATALNCAVSTLTALGSKEAENGLSVPDLYGGATDDRDIGSRDRGRRGSPQTLRKSHRRQLSRR
jgi:hypothetical protein